MTNAIINIITNEVTWFIELVKYMTPAQFVAFLILTAVLTVIFDTIEWFAIKFIKNKLVAFWNARKAQNQ